jgi:glycosyltransferase involved in cell wall biosynthesis
MNKPRVSVVMSVYNGERHLTSAIDSILNQTFTDFEFIIIDDGSSDASRELILSHDDPRIRLIDNDSNIGLPSSLNKGIKASRGTYIARMDQDDHSHPSRFELEIGVFESDPEVSLVCSEQLTIYEGAYDADAFSKLGMDDCKTRIIDQEVLKQGNCIPHGSVLFRKQDIVAMGSYDCFFDACEDYELWMRLCHQHKLVQIDKPLFIRNVQLGGFSIKNIERQEYLAEFVKLKYANPEQPLQNSDIEPEQRIYKTRAMTRLRSYGLGYIRHRLYLRGIGLLLKSLRLYPTFGGLLILLVSPLLVLKALIATNNESHLFII